MTDMQTTAAQKLSREDRKTVVRAAERLMHEAHEVKLSCMVGEREWACEDCDPTRCLSMVDHAELIELSIKLRKIK